MLCRLIWSTCQTSIEKMWHLCCSNYEFLYAVNHSRCWLPPAPPRWPRGACQGAPSRCRTSRPKCPPCSTTPTSHMAATTSARTHLCTAVEVGKKNKGAVTKQAENGVGQVDQALRADWPDLGRGPKVSCHVILYRWCADMSILVLIPTTSAKQEYKTD